MSQKVNVITCRLRRDGQYLLIVRDVCGAKQERQILSEKPAPEGRDIVIRGDRVIG